MTTRITLSPHGASDHYAALRDAITANGMPAAEGPLWYQIDVDTDEESLGDYLEDEGFDLSEVLLEEIV